MAYTEGQEYITPEEKKWSKVDQFIALPITEAAKRATIEMGLHPLDQGEIDQSGHYMLSLMEEKMERLRNIARGKDPSGH